MHCDALTPDLHCHALSCCVTLHYQAKQHARSFTEWMWVFAHCGQDEEAPMVSIHYD